MRISFVGLVVFFVFLWTGLLVEPVTAFQDQPEGQQNSTIRNRVEPDELAARAGSAIHWETRLAAAVEKSTMSGKPIFWYVPTLSGTFMDRKPVIDRYMLAGPFSWPAIINLINNNFVPLRLVPGTDEAEKYKLLPYEFVEPGFVVLSAVDQEMVRSVDRLSTLHPHWIYSLVAGAIDIAPSWSKSMGEPGRETLDELWTKMIASNWSDEMPADFSTPAGTEMELELLKGMRLFRNGQHADAVEVWRAASRKYPDHPLAWKAAMEAQGIGPFGRGFEVFGELNERAAAAGIDSPGSAAPEGAFSKQELWLLSTRYLLGMQDENGGFFDSDYDFGGADSLANVHVAVTALTGIALMRATDQELEAELRSKIMKAIRSALGYCRDDNNLNSADRDEILWAESYRLRFLCEAKRRGLDEGLEEDIGRVAGRLENLQMSNGTWYHEYPNAFVTATALLSLRDASAAGASVDRSKVDAGLARLARQRFPSGAYPYGTRPEGNEPARRVEPVPASAGRIPLCELARFVWGEIEQDALTEAAAIGIEHHELLARAMKYDNHTSTYAYGGFFFWYDMQARSEAIAAIAGDDKREELAAAQLKLILNLPELDGCFIDSHELGRCYGTAMALISLSQLESAMPKDGSAGK